MIEYPSISNSSKAPRQNCVVYDKLDGSNFRAKYTQKAGFSLFGTRTQLIDETTPMWGEMVQVFNRDLKENLTDVFKKNRDFRDFREIIVFGEFIGDNSFAGRHEEEPHKIVVFDVMVGHKDRKFLLPQEFERLISPLAGVETPEVLDIRNLTDGFIQEVREGCYDVKEGVICKGTTRSGAYVGGVWQCKIKTNAYFDKLKELHKEDWEKYGE